MKTQLLAALATLCITFSFYRSDVRAQAGSLDPTFNAAVDGAVYSVDVQADGRIIIGGLFANVNGSPRSRVARLNPDGTLDPDFNSAAGAPQMVHQVKVVGTNIYVLSIDDIRRFDLAGNQNFVFTIRAYVFDVDSSGRIYLGCFFPESGRARLARVNRDGTLDNSFFVRVGASVGDAVQDCFVQSPQTIVIGGHFLSVNDSIYAHFARISDDGSTDTSFQGYAGSPVAALRRRADGMIYRVSDRAFGRHFANGALDESFSVFFGSSSEDYFVTAGVQSDGKAIVSGNYAFPPDATRYLLARFNNDGTHDLSFAASPDDQVETVVVRNDGRILIGGSFTSVNGVSRPRIARLLGDSPVLGTQRNETRLITSWPAAYTNYTLQSVTSLDSTNWITVTNTSVLANQQFFVTNSTAQSSCFYRLIRQ